ncbi:MAG TPA: ABC transporter permease [Candidatus Didemnitutus sp.]|nr:ABC transporter permease [Candidatus Didemnitutus sp.]
MLTNLRLSLRALTRSWAFSLVAVVTLAVGIGSTTAMFSVLQALVISPFSFPKSDELVAVWSGDGWPLAPADFLDLQRESSSFTHFGLYRTDPYNVGLEHSQSVMGVSGTHDLLQAFGVAPMLGRLFAPADDVPKAPPVVILSHSLWRQLFGGDPGAIGRKLRVNGQDVAVVGVMPASFEFVGPWLPTADCQLWTPRPMELDEQKIRDGYYVFGIARMKDGVTVAQADAELHAIGERLARMYPDSNTGKKFLVRSMHDEMTRSHRKQVWLLFGSVGLVLLVACGNVASMLLARSARRQGELSVRVALGASGADLMNLALAESFVLAIIGALLGIGLAYAGVEILRDLSPVTAARRAAIALNPLALGFGLLATVLTAFLAGLPPALAALRTSLAAAMRADARGAVGSRSGHRVLRNLIIAQVAVAFVLANGAMLFSRAYFKLLDENRLLATDNVIEGAISPIGPRYADRAAQYRFWMELVDRVRSLPGVTSVGVTSQLPLESHSVINALVNDEPYDPTQVRLQLDRSSVTEDYFKAMGVRLVKGRNLRAEDGEGDVRGVLVNQKMVDRAWPNKDPIGEILRGNNPGKPSFVARVVGVVENVKQWGAAEELQPEMFTTFDGRWGYRMFIVIRTALPMAQMAPALVREVAAIDPELAVRDLRTMHQVVDKSTQSQRSVAELVDFFMAASLGLVAVGLYGTLSYHVLQRTREIGVRMAIGALKGDILKLVLLQGGRWVATGLALGLAGSVALSFALEAVIYGAEGLAIGPLALACAAVGIATLLACWLPARRAAKLDPIEALRAD